MKKLFSVFFVAIMVVTVASCSKDKNEDPAPVNPTASLSAKVDGNAFTGAVMVATRYTGATATQITGTASNGTDMITLKFNGSTTGTYPINQENSGTIASSTSIMSSMGGAPVGQIVITKFDESAKLISGTFTFDAYDNTLAVHHVTEGSFENVSIIYVSGK